MVLLGQGGEAGERRQRRWGFLVVGRAWRGDDVSGREGGQSRSGSTRATCTPLRRSSVGGAASASGVHDGRGIFTARSWGLRNSGPELLDTPRRGRARLDRRRTTRATTYHLFVTGSSPQMARGGRVRLEASGGAQLHSTDLSSSASEFPCQCQMSMPGRKLCRERQWALGLRCKCRAGGLADGGEGCRVADGGRCAGATKGGLSGKTRTGRALQCVRGEYGHGRIV